MQDKEKFFYCGENETYYTLQELKKFYVEEVAEEEKEDCNFYQWLSACLDKNGSLEEMKIVKSIYKNGKPVYLESNFKTDVYFPFTIRLNGSTWKAENGKEFFYAEGYFSGVSIFAECQSGRTFFIEKRISEDECIIRLDF